ncbi:hypothetical protein [Streptomyces sp. NRRL F-5053]|uniref:hypothetical protein n=1 Tax=Streptomyces sp. NRRL F-5053 TaxID=1463854 RepID=UPI0004CBCABE|nr:hypothetical protein [Streptomyces sp. NRRL F-5053]
MRTTAQRVITTLAGSAAIVMMAAVGASAATTGATTAPPAGITGWQFLGEYSKSACYELRDSYAGEAKCIRNAAGLYDLYVRV